MSNIENQTESVTTDSTPEQITHYSDAAAAADVIRFYKPNFTPKFVFILGSGLGAFSEQLEDRTTIPYYKLPSFPPCNIKGHAGSLHLGTLNGVPIACLEGRAHIYETTKHVCKTFVRTFKLLGAETIIATNAVGSLRPEVVPGSLVLITDHINFQFTSVLAGANDEEFGERFVPMGDAYDLELRDKFLSCAKKINLDLHEGVYLGAAGPCFETPAEIRAFKTLGADVVGMSLIPETIISRHCGMKVACVSVVTNLAEGISDIKLSHAQTLEGAKLGIGKLIKLLTAFCN